MTREQDWRIHEYMGNDLTGYEWATDDSDTEQAYAIKYIGYDAKYQVIPHYSTTWEGFGLISDWLKVKGLGHKIRWHEEHEFYQAFVHTTKYSHVIGYDPSAPQALANAFIAAMEERDNG